MPRNFRLNPYVGSVLAATLALPVVLVWSGPSRASGTGKTAQTAAELDKQFAGTVKPFLQIYCAGCHGKNKPQAQLDLTSFASLTSVMQDYPHWALVLERLDAKQMPPTTFGKQPTAKQREAVSDWIRAVKLYTAQRNAGDPGPVLARRLSNAEYDYTIRDLTGQNLRPTKEFPVDPADQEGFDNSGESLTLSPALMKKYYSAAKEIADHLVLTNAGIDFASHPVLAETDRDKWSILRIVDFYKKQPTDYADYFQAAWRYRHRAELGEPNAMLPTVAAEAKVSPLYLDTLWKTLSASGDQVGPLAKLRSQWNALPAPEKGHPDVARAGCEAMRDWVVGVRKKVAWKFPNLRVPGGFSDGGQCFVLWKDREYASHRRMLYPTGLQVGGTPASHTVQNRRNNNKNQPPQTITEAVDADIFVPQDEAERAPYIAAFNKFCSVFPDAFYISERGRMFVDDPGDKGRLLTAGLHNSMGYFRDDTPLMELILDEKGRRDLDRMWLDFDTVAYVPERMHKEFFVYERAEAGTLNDAEFNFVRAEDPNSTSDEQIKKLGDLYLAKARRNGGQPEALQAIVDHFKWVSTHIRATEKARMDAEPVQRKALVEFAQRAYRRPLTSTEGTDLLAFYQMLRQKDGLTHEDAMRDCVISVLMSPKFLFRMDLAASDDLPNSGRTAGVKTVAVTTTRTVAPPSGNSVQPLPDYALASRLSYFLWSSMPDKELLAHAAAGDLHKPEVLSAQTHRMLKDSRVRALALEFGGNWLDFRRFEEANAVDRNRFPSFNDSLREAMFEEPVHFLVDEFQNDRPVTEMLFGKHTFVNASLAKHYSMTDVKPAGDAWVRVDNADKYGRGGLLPMAVFLTQNSPGLRTSPVKRGYWVVKRVLGQYIPPPPANVPVLPNDESKMGNLTLRQALEEHRKNPACAACHAMFDSYGLVFEGYGPIGEQRAKDLGGKPIDANAPFPGGSERNGVAGLQSFIRQQRQKDFLDTLGRKMLSYGLGRTLQPSDDSLLQQMQQQLAAHNDHFDALVDTIVTSRQFRYRRASATLARN